MPVPDDVPVPDDYEIDDDPARIDVDAAWQFLSTQAYWARWFGFRAPDPTYLERPAAPDRGAGR